MAMSTETELQRQNERFELLLNLTTKITSSLDLREVLRAIAANIREVIHADAVSVSLSDPAPGKARLYAMDFLYGKGVLAGGTNFACKRQRLTTGVARTKSAAHCMLERRLRSPSRRWKLSAHFC